MNAPRITRTAADAEAEELANAAPVYAPVKVADLLPATPPSNEPSTEYDPFSSPRGWQPLPLNRYKWDIDRQATLEGWAIGTEEHEGMSMTTPPVPTVYTVVLFELARPCYVVDQANPMPAGTIVMATKMPKSMGPIFKLADDPTYEYPMRLQHLGLRKWGPGKSKSVNQYEGEACGYPRKRKLGRDEDGRVVTADEVTAAIAEQKASA